MKVDDGNRNLCSKTEAYAGREPVNSKSSKIVLFLGHSSTSSQLGCGRKIPGCLRGKRLAVFWWQDFKEKNTCARHIKIHLCLL